MKEALKAWTHSAYGILRAIWIARSSRFEETGRLSQILAELCQQVPSDLGFVSNVSILALTPGSIRTDADTEKIIGERATQAAVNLLLINLVVVFDEIGGARLKKAGHTPPKMPGDKAKWLRENLPERDAWAAKGVTELVAIRNAIVHAQASWSGRAVKMLKLAGVDAPPIGTPLRPGVDDLFRYKRAVRTALNSIRAV
jgi:hypothetical protein